MGLQIAISLSEKYKKYFIYRLLPPPPPRDPPEDLEGDADLDLC